MIRTLALAITALAAAFSLQSIAAPAGADTAAAETAGPDGARADVVSCVTRSEFDRAATGMSKARVHRIFGTTGTFGDGGAGGYSRLYRQCASGSDCRVMMEYAVGPGGVHRVATRHWNGVC